jgi:hypothetical protein
MGLLVGDKRRAAGHQNGGRNPGDNQIAFAQNHIHGDSTINTTRQPVQQPCPAIESWFLLRVPHGKPSAAPRRGGDRVLWRSQPRVGPFSQRFATSPFAFAETIDTAA